MTIEGSNDNFDLDVNVLATVGSELIEGWNYYDLSSMTPAYQYYRIKSNLLEGGGCSYLGELNLTGYEIKVDDLADEGTDNDCYLYKPENNNAKRCSDGAESCDLAS